MINPLGVCLLFAAFLCCTNLSYARQVPKECSKGPSYWCQNLKTASDCGAVAHCVSTVWETQTRDVSKDEISDKIVKLFRDLKDVKDLINEDYLATRIRSTCNDLPYPVASRICRENTANLEKYILHVLQSNTSAADMCTLISMCNNKKIENIIGLNHKKTTHQASNKGKLLGGERCTWGPSYWCSNISTGHECGATRHCIDRVWSKMEVQKDNDSICQICLDMVKQARDQLESNETQEELREVFEGSCKLIPVKLVAKECMKLADEFIPDLVETLASQMNPHTVCSVAGLCNNADIDVLLEGYNQELLLRTECNNCETTVGVLRKRYDNTQYTDFLVNLLEKCRDMDSFSDACSTLVFKYYENIRAAIDQDFNSKSVCHLSGQCAYRQITRDLYNFPAVKEVKADDDIPCEFCEQLVIHLRDIFVANTTGTEVQKVLTALCKRTGNFKDECIHLLDEYYPIIYNYIISGLQPKQICSLVGVCTDTLSNMNVPIAPLLPAEMEVSVMMPGVKLIGQDEAKINEQPIETEVNIGPVVALPLERMFPVMPQTKAQCAFCQYFLHYLQVELSDTKTEEKIRNLVDKACDRLPQSVEEECKSFVSGYGPAVIAMLVQEIDPTVVCPSLGLCPAVDTTQVRNVDINSEKSNCPLCLFAVEQLEAMLKNNRTETSIRLALDNLCNHLSQKLRTECMDFVDTYSNQLVEMLVANMDAQEICVYLKLCSDNSKKVDPLGVRPIDRYHDKPFLRSDLNKRRRPMLPKHMLEGGDIETNEIPDHTVNGRPVRPVLQKTVCVVCEFVMKEIDDAIKDKHNEDDIKKIVHSVCRRMPKSVQDQCDNFVEKYADLIISLLEQQLQPDEVCQEIKLCDPTNKLNKVQVEILDCAVCETVVMAVKKVLSNDKTDRNIVHIVEKSCSLLPAKYRQRCHTMMEIYGDSVIHLIEDIGTKGVCEKIGLCANHKSGLVHMYRDQH